MLQTCLGKMQVGYAWGTRSGSYSCAAADSGKSQLNAAVGPDVGPSSLPALGADGLEDTDPGSSPHGLHTTSGDSGRRTPAPAASPFDDVSADAEGAS